MMMLAARITSSSARGSVEKRLASEPERGRLPERTDTSSASYGKGTGCTTWCGRIKSVASGRNDLSRLTASTYWPSRRHRCCSG